MTPYGFRCSDGCVLAAIKGLKAVDLRVSGLGLDDRGAAIVRLASRLTALEQLDVTYEEDSDATVAPQDVRLPRCSELAVLRSTTLTHLSVAIAGGTQDVLRLSGLPNLESCHLLSFAWMQPLLRAVFA